MIKTDLTGRPLTSDEVAILEIYEGLKALLRRPDLAPNVRASARAALVSMWQAVNGLGLLAEPLDEFGL